MFASMPIYSPQSIACSENRKDTENRNSLVFNIHTEMQRCNYCTRFRVIAPHSV